jgi:hypothetical protein
VQRYPYPLLVLAPQLLPIHHYSLLPMLLHCSSQSRLLTIPSLEDTVDRLGLMLPSVVRHAQREIQLHAQNPTAVMRMSPALQLLAPAEITSKEMAVVLILACAAPIGATVAMKALGVIVVNSG